MKYFEEIYIVVLMVVALVGYTTTSTIGILILFLLGILVLLLSNDISYLIPNMIFSIFTINNSFSINDINIPLIIIGSIYILLILVQIIINGINLKKMKSCIGLFGLAIANMIPIFYASIPNGRNIFYLFFFIDLIYFLIYLIFVNGIKKDSLNLIAYTMSYLGILISIECAIMVIRLSGSVENILTLDYSLGWSDSSAAGVMISMSIPFVFYIIGNLKSGSRILFNHLKVLFMLGGVILTTSRGAFIFANLEALALTIALFYFARYKMAYRWTTGTYIGIVVSLMMIFSFETWFFFRDVNRYIIFDTTFSNNKLELWRLGIEEWDKNALTFFFGSGFATAVNEARAGVYEVSVYHSAFVETLVVGGVLAIIFLMIHYIEKYRAVRSVSDELFKITMLTGLIAVDLYSIIDNTYHMYYCMIPFVITIAVIDSKIYLNDKKYERVPGTPLVLE